MELAGERGAGFRNPAGAAIRAPAVTKGVKMPAWTLTLAGLILLALPGCPGLVSARGHTARPDAPEILLAPLAGTGPGLRRWIWAADGPYLFSR